MLKTFTIENYKSIERMHLDLGRINVFIGENGAGKSNIVEAIALAGAAQANKLDHEFLTSRGIRAVAPRLMRSAFTSKAPNIITLTAVGSNNVTTRFVLKNDEKPYSTWRATIQNDVSKANDFATDMQSRLDKKFLDVPSARRAEIFREFAKTFSEAAEVKGKKVQIKLKVSSITQELASILDLFPNAEDNLSSFVVYSPEDSTLRKLEHESQIEPLGVRGEGMLKLLTIMEQSEEHSRISQVRDGLRMLGWFEKYSIVEESTLRMEIADRFLAGGLTFDQRSANEGFLFIAFYFALFCSSLTPQLFAIDNIDASLNPKLCRAMIEQLVHMAKCNKKQVILSTHNPAVLDGLDLNDDDQRLFIIQRNRHGRTDAIRRMKPASQSEMPRKLSEMFMAGLIGGLPKGF